MLFSGGLDSILAAKVLESQGIEVMGICFTSTFFDCEKAKQTAQDNGLQIETVDISKDMIELVKNPPSGYGKNLNPCIDCHSLMISKTSAIMKDKGYDFMATGEVLGQRPFSQNKEALERIIKLSGTEILRPLSARLLPETEIEQKGIVKRYKLLDISGRSRERQMELAKKYGIKNYPSPAGGCLLTDPDFSERLMKMLDNWKECDENDIDILKHGRPYWFQGREDKKILAIIGRDHGDNISLEKAVRSNDILIELADTVGPTSLIRGIKDSSTAEIILEIPTELQMSKIGLAGGKEISEVVNTVCLLTGWYSVKSRGKKVKFNIKIIK